MFTVIYINLKKQTNIKIFFPGILSIGYTTKGLEIYLSNGVCHMRDKIL